MELNYEYINKNLSIFDKEPKHLQTFITRFNKGDIESAKQIHKKEILGAIIYSNFNHNKFLLDPSTGKPLYLMSGFLEQKGRIPLINEIEIIRGKHYFSVVKNKIISDIGFSILT